MTSLTLDDNTARYQIRSYQPGRVQVNDQIITHSVIITSKQLILDWPPQTLSELTEAHLLQIATLKPDILILGTGSTLHFPKLELYGALINQGIGVEIMDTRAACRTYNALSAEERNVVAALLLS